MLTVAVHGAGLTWIRTERSLLGVELVQRHRRPCLVSLRKLPEEYGGIAAGRYLPERSGLYGRRLERHCSR